MSLCKLPLKAVKQGCGLCSQQVKCHDAGQLFNCTNSMVMQITQCQVKTANVTLAILPFADCITNLPELCMLATFRNLLCYTLWSYVSTLCHSLQRMRCLRLRHQRQQSPSLWLQWTVWLQLWGGLVTAVSGISHAPAVTWHHLWDDLCPDYTMPCLHAYNPWSVWCSLAVQRVQWFMWYGWSSHWLLKQIHGQSDLCSGSNFTVYNM